MTDRLLPDKAIDVLDEVGARKHIKNINVPQNILDLEQKIEDIKVEKNKVVKSQKFEEAAALRDTEKKLQESLEAAKNEWEEETKNKRFPIEEEDIAEVVHMMTGIPVKRMVQAETEKARWWGYWVSRCLTMVVLPEPDGAEKMSSFPFTLLSISS